MPPTSSSKTAADQKAKDLRKAKAYYKYLIGKMKAARKKKQNQCKKKITKVSASRKAEAMREVNRSKAQGKKYYDDLMKRKAEQQNLLPAELVEESIRAQYGSADGTKERKVHEPNPHEVIVIEDDEEEESRQEEDKKPKAHERNHHPSEVIVIEDDDEEKEESRQPESVEEKEEESRENGDEESDDVKDEDIKDDDGDDDDDNDDDEDSIAEVYLLEDRSYEDRSYGSPTNSRLSVNPRLNLGGHYAVLGLELGASGCDIKKAYKTLAKQYHPDKNRDDGANDDFIRVNLAYQVLSNKKKRRKYDAKLLSNNNNSAS